jgi:WD40 repeat protein
MYNRHAYHTLVHKTGIPISAFDISQDRTHAVLAGRDILKTIRIHGSNCFEGFNLRSNISTPRSTNPSAQHKDHIGANDVKWSHGNYNTVIATAAGNGRIILYDINRDGVELARLHEHTRQVHRISFNPHQGYFLLSGSQDATIRLWDLRDLAGDRSVMTCRSRNRFPGNNEGVRDVQWSPADGYEFAVGTDNGVIQRWDFRKENAPLLSINAHLDKTCQSIDYHPSGRYLASAGADKLVKVWDVKSTDRRMKPSWELRAPQNVSIVRWRRTGNLPDSEGINAQQCTFLATSYNQRDPRIHIWDLRRPHVPYKEIDRYDNVTGLLWCDEDLLWSVGMAGVFTQTNIDHIHTPIERQSVNVIAGAPSGEMGFFSKSRARKPFRDASPSFLRRTHTGGSSAENLASSRSGTDGSLEEPSVLGSSLKNRRQKSMGSRTTEGTPPLPSADMVAARLEEALNPYGKLHRSQFAAAGHVTGPFDLEAFKHLAKHYGHPLAASDLEKDHDLHDAMFSLLDENAIHAARAGQFRLAQSWRMLGLAVRKELWGRAKRSRECRNDPSSSSKVVNRSLGRGSKAESVPVLDATRPRTQLSAVSNLESTSNMSTPLAKPVQESHNTNTSADDLDLNDNSSGEKPGHNGQTWRSPQVHESSVSQNHSGHSLSRSLHSGLPAVRHATNSPGNGDAAQKAPVTFEGFLDIDQEMHERRAAISNYRARPRPILRFDEPTDPSPRSLSARPRVHRNDSEESFQMLSASTDSGPRSFSIAGSFGESRKSNASELLPELWDESLSRNGDAADDYRVSQDQESPADSFPNIFETSPSDVPIMASDANLNTIPNHNILPLQRPEIPVAPVVHWRRSHKAQEESALSRTTHDIIPSDFLPPETPIDHPLPWSATSLIAPFMNFHLGALSDTQLPAFLILYLLRLFPSSFDTSAASATLISYHDQLVSLDLFSEAASLRNYCYPGYPEVWQLGIGLNEAAGYYCLTCRKAVKGKFIGFCTRCKNNWGLCPICDSRNSPLPVPGDIAGNDVSKDSITMQENIQTQRLNPNIPRNKLWAWCQDCGHGGHHSCLRYWWSNAVVSEGACPTQGCLHDCMPGVRRDEKKSEILAESKRAKLKAGGVLKDAWVVGESRAVERTRGLVAGSDGKALEGIPMVRGLSGKSSVLFAGAGVKKVRLMEPGEGASRKESIGSEEQSFREERSRLDL